MDYSRRAEDDLAAAGKTSGDYLTPYQAGVLSALTGIGYAILHLTETIENSR